MTTAQVQALATDHITPLMLDLNGHGPLTLSIDAGVQFDVGNRGQVATTGWVAPGNGLLVLDRNSNGVIDNGGELFGSGTLLPDGSHAVDGFAALATLDANEDGVINVQDPTFNALKVWIDANSDGVTQVAELKSLDALSISGLHLDAAQTVAIDNGNLVGLLGSYDSTDGSTHTLADVWLVTGVPVQPAALRTAASDLTASLGRFTEQFDGVLNVAGPALGLPVGVDDANARPWQADLSTSLVSPLSSFVEQNSVTPLAVFMAISPTDLLSKDLTLVQAVVVNGSVDSMTGKPQGK